MQGYVYWNGISGTQYKFELFPLGAQYLAVPGVYIFCHELPDGSWHADYVGETADFSDRLCNGCISHDRFSDIRAAGATHICTLHVPGYLTARESIETDLRHRLNLAVIDSEKWRSPVYRPGFFCLALVGLVGTTLPRFVCGFGGVLSARFSASSRRLAVSCLE